VSLWNLSLSVSMLVFAACSPAADSGAPCEPSRWLLDADHDGFGDSTHSSQACEAPEGYVSDALIDCDDTQAAVHPGADEVCNGLDDDCDIMIDDTDPDVIGQMTGWYDADADGYGNPARPVTRCTLVDGASFDNTDCDDTRASVHPGAVELCGGLDDDCDGMVDDADPDLAETHTWYLDADGDGYGDASTAMTACFVPDAVADGTDCDDASRSTHPGAPEVCNGHDDDCDGLADDDDPALADSDTFYKDADGDGYGDSSAFVHACVSPEGYAVYGDDCNDANPAVNPGARDRCFGEVTGIDLDCDGLLTDCDPFFDDATAIIDGEASGDQAGGAVAALADVDGDGLPEIAAGAASAASGRGRAYVLDGPREGSSNLSGSSAIVEGSVDVWGLGSALADPGDLDGDGRTDLLIGAPETGTDQEGVVCIFEAPFSASSSADDASVILQGTLAFGHAGSTLAGLGDVNDDGWPDIAVAAPATGEVGAAAMGTLYVLDGPFRSDGDLVEHAATIVTGEGGNDHFGHGLAAAGDVDGDGLPDLIVGAPDWSGHGSATGAAWLFSGPMTAASLLDSTSTFWGEASGDAAGASVAGPGDINGDGYADLTIGAPGASRVSVSGGSVYLVFGPVTGTLGLAGADGRLDGNWENACAGPVSGLGDIDADGLGDLLIGRSCVSDGTHPDAWLALAPHEGISVLSEVDLRLRGETGISWAMAGTALAGTGDVSGDGVPDLILADPWAEKWSTDESRGVLYFFSGSEL
jgi:hypothetical protein